MRQPGINEWLIHHAYQAQASGSARIFVAAEGEQVIGYFSLTVGQVDIMTALDRVSQARFHYSSC